MAILSKVALTESKMWLKFKGVRMLLSIARCVGGGKILLKTLNGQIGNTNHNNLKLRLRQII